MALGAFTREGATRPFIATGAQAALATPRDKMSSQVAISAGRGGVDTIATGRLSLAFLEGMVLSLVLFYIWTRRMQGGG